MDVGQGALTLSNNSYCLFLLQMLIDIYNYNGGGNEYYLLEVWHQAHKLGDIQRWAYMVSQVIQLTSSIPPL